MIGRKITRYAVGEYLITRGRNYNSGSHNTTACSDMGITRLTT